MKRKLPLAIVVLGLSLALLVTTGALVASDHDDGENDNKARALNLTDLYAFREKDQNPNAAVPEGDLVFVMNTNPRSVARQQYYFSPNARYQFHVTRVLNKDAQATGHTDLLFRFDFSQPSGNQQRIRVTVLNEHGPQVVTQTVGGGPILTTPINSEPIVNRINVGGHIFRITAGLREDPFFFDVEQFFRVRAGALGIGPAAGFRSPGLDFAAGYNVNAIVVGVPLAFLQGTTPATTFDLWETIWFGGRQVEQLAQPAINEGLLFTNDLLNAYNSVGPDCVAQALAGIAPCASAAAPIFAEAIRTLTALGNSPARIGQIVGAFLPDVLRIDSTQHSGYARVANTLGRPITGRLLTDDVIDITLSVVVGFNVPALKTDNVSYNGPNLGGSGHKPLLPAFPFLAAPN